jgi:cytidyltransferase-like protein
MKKVFVSGCYDLLHSGHIEFFKQASQFGDLYVGIGSDATYQEYKHRKPMFPQEERLFMVRNIKAVKEAYINEGSGVIDFIPTLDIVKPDIFVVNAEGGSEAKRQLCKERGIEYIELKRTPAEGLQARSSSSLKAEIQKNNNREEECKGIPTRLDLAGTWIDQPYVSVHHPGWAITISLEPTFEVRDRCGLSTSTRKVIEKIWPMKLPNMDPETLARLVFCFENNPEREDGHISGAQDAIGICVPGLCRHYYDNNFWPKKIEHTNDEMTLRFLEEHLVMIPMTPRLPGCSVTETKDITPSKVKALADAADECWNAIISHDLDAFAAAYKASFEAQVAMFPGMIKPTYIGHPEQDNSYITETIDQYSTMDGVLALKMPGAGGGGYLALVVKNAKEFIAEHPEAFDLHIRREL